MLQQHSRHWRRIAVVLGVILSLAALATTASAAPPDPNLPPQAQDGQMLGIVQPHGLSSGFLTGGNLRYHNGPVMHTNKVYAIYWVPAGYTVSGTYEGLINQFFTDVQADSGKTSNVYYAAAQYHDTTGSVSYNSTFAGSVVDTNVFPASGCTLYTGVTVCLTDAQLRSEIKSVISAQGWTANSSTEFFMFTPAGVGSCNGSSCAFKKYCAYHSWIGSGSTAILYANMPYTGTALSGCGVSTSPNNDIDADSTINVVSHEHNETVTDEQGNAWYDLYGQENGDKCAWKFGTVTNGANQTINSHRYLLQGEWSNKSGKCVWTGQ